MNNIASLLIIKSSLSSAFSRNFAVSAVNNKTYSCKLLVVGGGSGGCTIGAKFAKKSSTKDKVIILEPSSNHYYQPLWTLVGAGITRVEATRRDEKSVLPKNALWLKDYAETLDPQGGKVTTRNGDVISYEYLVIAVGLKNDYDQIPGLQEALNDSHSRVSTIYDAKYCEKTWRDIQSFRGGEAVFSYPDTPIKCPGAPQKIAYLAESYFRKTNVRSKSNVTYNTCLPVIFGVKKYADSLLKVVERKGMKVNYRSVLNKIDPRKKEAVFTVTEEGDKRKDVTMKYDLLHVTPPMSTPDFLKKSSQVVDGLGFLDVDKHTLQHTKFPNIYGIGDCTSTPNSKTAAAIVKLKQNQNCQLDFYNDVFSRRAPSGYSARFELFQAKQSYVLERNLVNTMSNRPPAYKYDGYGACPLVTSYNTCILAEFIYGGVPHETFPFDQAKERTSAYYMKRHLFPFIYWNFMLKGWYHGPEMVRKIINPFGK